MLTQSKTSFLSILADLVEYSDAPEERKHFLLPFLTDARFKSMSVQDLGELMSVLQQANKKIEKETIASNDPDAINELTARKQFVRELFYEAQMDAFAKAGILPDDGAEIKPELDKQGKIDQGWLLDYYAGLAE